MSKKCEAQQNRSTHLGVPKRKSFKETATRISVLNRNFPWKCLHKISISFNLIWTSAITYMISNSSACKICWGIFSRLLKWSSFWGFFFKDFLFECFFVVVCGFFLPRTYFCWCLFKASSENLKLLTASELQ